MPLSKEAMAEYMKVYREKRKLVVNPCKPVNPDVNPTSEGLQGGSVNPAKVVNLSVNPNKEVLVTKEKAGKLLLICESLNHEIRGLQGKENMLDLVRYGIGGTTMRDVKKTLGG